LFVENVEILSLRLVIGEDEEDGHEEAFGGLVEDEDGNS
jgi:hypothetical protein